MRKRTLNKKREANRQRSQNSPLGRFHTRIGDKKGRNLTQELLTKQPQVKTISKTEFDNLIAKIPNLERDNEGLTVYEGLNNMPADFYYNLTKKNKLRLRENMTTSAGFGTRRVKNLNMRNADKFTPSVGRTSRKTAIGRQRNVKFVSGIARMRFKPIRILDNTDRVANKVSNFMTFVDNTIHINLTTKARFEQMRSDILRFVGSDHYLIKLVRKDFKGVVDGSEDMLILPIDEAGLMALQAWITDIFEGESHYEESAIEFGEYQNFKDSVGVVFYKIETKDKRVRFCPDILLKNYDLDILQIYKTPEEAESKYNVHCFVYACKVLNVPEKTLIRLKHCLGGRDLITKDYPILCNILQRNIRVKKYPEVVGTQNNRKTIKPTKKHAQEAADKLECLDFVRYHGHIMADIKLPISSYSIKNYEEVKDLPNFPYIIGYRPNTQKYSRNYKVATTTAIIIKHLIESKSFEHSYDMEKVGNNVDLSVNEVSSDLYYEQKPFKRHERSNIPLESIYYADLECLTSAHINNDNERTAAHRAFMAGYIPHADTYINKLGEETKTKPHIFRCKTKEQVAHSTAIYDMLDHIAKRNNKFYNEKATMTLRNKTLEEGGTQEEADDVEVKTSYPYVLYFHNLKYDFTFIKKLNIKFKTICEKSGAIYSVSFIHKNKHFILKDSFKILPFALGKFKDKLNLDVGKADFEMYDYFNDENLNMNDDIEYKGHTIRPLDKYIEYLELDCITLKAGVKKLYEALKSFDEYLNIYNFLTISSLAFDYFGHCGGWDGLYEISGSALEFVNKSQVGGRCCLKDNKKIVCNPSEQDLKYLKEGENFKPEDVLIILNMILEDFDMKSCYPSAIKISKFPIGYAKKLKNNDIEELNKYYENQINKVLQPELIGDTESGHLYKYSHIIYDVDIKFSGYLQIPILSVKKESGTRKWTNDINETITISSLYLKDIIDTGYYKIESIKIKHGIYWNEGYNNKCQGIIQRLYNERLEYKDEDNKKYNPCMSECLKLILNSIYGKCGLKASKTGIQIMSTKQKERYEINNFGDLVYSKTLNSDNWQVKTRINTYDHFNMAHISSLILENSKVLMNHVIKAAENIGCFMGYTDTDSFHMDKSKIEALVIEYRKMFKKELIGEQLTQFSVDFDPLYIKDIKYPQYSVKFLSPGLKWYYDKLAHDEDKKNSNGVLETTRSLITSEHVRNKGCDKVNLQHYNKVNNLTMTELYLSLIRGDKRNIDLCKGKTRFEFKNFGVSCKPEMLKEFKF